MLLLLCRYSMEYIYNIYCFIYLDVFKVWFSSVALFKQKLKQTKLKLMLLDSLCEIKYKKVIFTLLLH